MIRGLVGRLMARFTPDSRLLGFRPRMARAAVSTRDAELARMREDCNRVITDLYAEFTIRLADAEARFCRARCVDIVARTDVGLYVHPDGQVSEIGGEVGSC